MLIKQVWTGSSLVSYLEIWAKTMVLEQLARKATLTADPGPLTEKSAGHDDLGSANSQKAVFLLPFLSCPF